MAAYATDSTISLRPFAHRREGRDVIIEDIQQKVYLAIPPEGLEILNWLAAGATVGEAARRYEDRYGETPDIDDFLEALDREGLLFHAGGDSAPVSAPPPRYRHYLDLEWVSEAAARRLFSLPVLAVCGVIVAIAVVMIADDPGLVPGPTVFLFPEYFAASTWAALAIAFVAVMLHEAAHVLGARAAGVPARIAVGHRLYVVVAETQMDGLWMAPKRRRYLAFLAGMIVDAVSVSLFIAVLWASRAGMIELSSPLVWLTGAVVFTYLARLLWQCFFFLRTDLYYLLATAFGGKNLMADTEAYLRSLVARLRGALPADDLSMIPRSEMRFIRLYAVAWVLCRFISIGALFVVALPILFGYLSEAALYLAGRDSLFGSFDFVTVAIISLFAYGIGITLWVRSLDRSWVRWRTRRPAPEAVAVG